MQVRKITLIALLSSLAIVGRYAFQAIPNTQPVTAIIIITGAMLGFFLAALLVITVAFISNMLLGMGVWTVWQIIAWLLIALFANILGRFNLNIKTWIAFSVSMGYMYGFIISVSNYFVFGGYLIPYYLAGLPFDTSHAIGNGIFFALLYPVLKPLLLRYTGRLN